MTFAEAAGPDVRASDPTEGPSEPPFRLTPAAAGAPATALVFASPHSGRVYPASLMAASGLDAFAIRRSEDAFVDDLVAAAPGRGAPLIAANLARAYVDLNREPWELDPAMFEDELPEFAKGRTPRVAAGLGAIARIVSEGQEIYRRKLTFAEARGRIERVHRPYHAALAGLVEAARRRHGVAVLIDWHSMPAAAGGRCDVVLGDRFGASAAPAIARRVQAALEAQGWRVARNTPYAGGYTTEAYGRPGAGLHALQIELSRGLYLNEATLERSPRFTAVRDAVGRVIAALAGEDWRVA